MPCTVQGCPNRVHSRGLCSRHYGQMWRKGHVYETQQESIARKSREIAVAGEEMTPATREEKLAEARRMYNLVVGYEAHMRWRKEIEALEA